MMLASRSANEWRILDVWVVSAFWNGHCVSLSRQRSDPDAIVRGHAPQTNPTGHLVHRALYPMLDKTPSARSSRLIGTESDRQLRGLGLSLLFRPTAT